MKRATVGKLWADAWQWSSMVCLSAHIWSDVLFFVGCCLKWRASNVFKFICKWWLLACKWQCLRTHARCYLASIRLIRDKHVYPYTQFWERSATVYMSSRSRTVFQATAGIWLPVSVMPLPSKNKLVHLFVHELGNLQLAIKDFQLAPCVIISNWVVTRASVRALQSAVGNPEPCNTVKCFFTQLNSVAMIQFKKVATSR